MFRAAHVRPGGSAHAPIRAGEHVRPPPIFDYVLRTLLAYADEDPSFAALADDGGRAFVSQSLRPYVLAALLDREEQPPAIVVAGYERVEHVEDRGQFAIRGGLLDLFPATEERAVRVDLFGDEIESLRWFSTFTQRSLQDAEEVEVAPAAELSEEHRELAEIAAAMEEERPDIAELLPVERFHP